MVKLRLVPGRNMPPPPQGQSPLQVLEIEKEMWRGFSGRKLILVPISLTSGKNYVTVKNRRVNKCNIQHRLTIIWRSRISKLKRKTIDFVPKDKGFNHPPPPTNIHLCFVKKIRKTNFFDVFSLEWVWTNGMVESPPIYFFKKGWENLYIDQPTCRNIENTRYRRQTGRLIFIVYYQYIC